MFMSTRRKAALETFLPYENRVSEFLVASGMSIICFLAFRAITQKPLKFFLGEAGRSGLKYFVKVDADSYLNVPALSQWLSGNKRGKFVLGKVLGHEKIKGKEER